jgi:hypothetical protein
MFQQVYNTSPPPPTMKQPQGMHCTEDELAPEGSGRGVKISAVIPARNQTPAIQPVTSHVIGCATLRHIHASGVTAL